MLCEFVDSIYLNKIKYDGNQFSDKKIMKYNTKKYIKINAKRSHQIRVWHPYALDGSCQWAN